MHRATIKGAPLAIDRRLHLVADDDMRVQVRVPSPTVEVIERGRDQACHLHSRDSAVPCIPTRSGRGYFWLDEGKCRGDRFVMCIRDARLRRHIGDAPEDTR